VNPAVTFDGLSNMSAPHLGQVGCLAFEIETEKHTQVQSTITATAIVTASHIARPSFTSELSRLPMVKGGMSLPSLLTMNLHAEGGELEMPCLERSVVNSMTSAAESSAEV
jgi:hypothetical protein